MTATRASPPLSATAAQSEGSKAAAEGRPVVALESAVITHGLPREPLGDVAPDLADDLLPDAARDEPLNLAAARAMERAVRDAGAEPATVAVLNGRLRVGLDPAELAALARDRSAHKASVRDLAVLAVRRESAGSTVAGTLRACTLASPPIRVFATGGIGGVHRGWTERPDVSADLFALAASPVAVVCSGAKSLLDLPATVEALESLGVPLVGLGTSHLPRFTSPPEERLPLAHRVDSPDQAARLFLAHTRDLRLDSAVVFVRPVPSEHAVDPARAERALAEAERAADDAGVVGPARTPFLLHALAEAEGPDVLRANVALLIANARDAARLAVAVARVEKSPEPSPGA